MAKDLRQVLGTRAMSDVGTLRKVVDTSSLHQYTDEIENGSLAYGCWINFVGLGPNPIYEHEYKINDLIGCGFYITSCTDRNKHSIVFADTNKTYLTEDIYGDKTLVIGISGLSYNTRGYELVQFIYESINEHPSFCGQYIGCGHRSSSMLWLYDKRGNVSPDMQQRYGTFYTDYEPYLLSLESRYTGLPVKKGQKWDPAFIDGRLTYSDGRTMIAYYEGNGGTLSMPEPFEMYESCHIVTSYKDMLFSTIEIPYTYATKVIATYTGPNIFLYNEFSIRDLTVRLEYTYEPYNCILTTEEYIIQPSQIIEKIGLNYFVAIEKVSGDKLVGQFYVIGTRVVLDIRAKYIGPDMPIGDTVNPDHIVVEMDTVDENNENFLTILLKYNSEIITLENGMEITDEYTLDIPGLLVTNIGDNIRTVVYKDPVINWTGDIVIPGIRKILKFTTKYLGETRILGSVINKSQVYAELTILKDYFTGEIITERVPDEDWEFYSAPIVTEANKGVIKTRYKENIFSTVTVPYIDPKILRLRCWYEGVKIEVGNPFNRHDVVAYMVDENGYVFRIETDDIFFIDETVINEDGWNFYRLRLKNDKYSEIIGTYAVPGYTPLETHEDIEFKMVYIDERNNYRELDYTEHFKEFLMLDDYLYVGWESVQQAIIELGIYGKYVLTIPKKCGLSNKYDQDWEVVCTYRGAISASILKNHYKEENETWQQRKQLQQTRKKWWKVPNES